MHNAMDSRALDRADCYGQRFMKAGSFPYALLPAGTAAMSSDRPFVIEVAEGKGKSEMAQHMVTVTWKNNKFKATPAELKIQVGDMVMWNCNQRGAALLSVIGSHEFFDSSHLKNESGYSHAFGLPGDFRWIDAHGSNVSGMVIVRDPCCKTDADLKRWQKSLEEGTVVMIRDGKVEPSCVEIAVGQTVFFLVVKGPGISITDARLSKHIGAGPHKVDSARPGAQASAS